MSEELLYVSNGFTFETEIAPDYMYLFQAERKNKSQYTVEKLKNNSALKWEKELTEEELLKLNSLHRIWNAGKTMYRKQCQDA